MRAVVVSDSKDKLVEIKEVELRPIQQGEELDEINQNFEEMINVTINGRMVLDMSMK